MELAEAKVAVVWVPLRRAEEEESVASLYTSKLLEDFSSLAVPPMVGATDRLTGTPPLVAVIVRTGTSTAVVVSSFSATVAAAMSTSMTFTVAVALKGPENGAC